MLTPRGISPRDSTTGSMEKTYIDHFTEHCLVQPFVIPSALQAPYFRYDEHHFFHCLTPISSYTTVHHREKVRPT